MLAGLAGEPAPAAANDESTAAGTAGEHAARRPASLGPSPSSSSAATPAASAARCPSWGLACASGAPPAPHCLVRAALGPSPQRLAASSATQCPWCAWQTWAPATTPILLQLGVCWEAGMASMLSCCCAGIVPGPRPPQLPPLPPTPPAPARLPAPARPPLPQAEAAPPAPPLPEPGSYHAQMEAPVSQTAAAAAAEEAAPPPPPPDPTAGEEAEVHAEPSSSPAAQPEAAVVDASACAPQVPDTAAPVSMPDIRRELPGLPVSSALAEAVLAVVSSPHVGPALKAVPSKMPHVSAPEPPPQNGHAHADADTGSLQVWA